MSNMADNKKSSAQSLLKNKVNSSTTGAYKSSSSIHGKYDNVKKEPKEEEKYSDEYIQNSLMAHNKILKLTSEKLEEAEKKKITQGVITKKKLEENNALLDEQNTDNSDVKIVTYLENELDIVSQKISKAYSDIPVKGKRIIYSLLGVVGCLLLVLLYRYEVEIHTYEISIKGTEEVSIYEGGNYKEAGYVAYNHEKENSTNKVKVIGEVNTEVVGEYKLEYVIHNFWKDNRVSRTVKVLKNPLDGIYFTLKGEEEVKVKLREKYVDEGYNIKSNDDVNYDNYVTVTNLVDTNKIGEYEVRYLIKINKKEQELVRKVIVEGEPYTVNIVNPSPTRSNVTVQLISNINNFSHFVVNGNKVLKDSIEFTAPENGVYSFKMYDTKGKGTNIDVNINNIDRVPPTGSCQAFMNRGNNNTTFYFSINDQSKVAKYIHVNYRNNAYQYDGFSIPAVVDNGNVIVYDEAGNFGEVSCEYDFTPFYPNGAAGVFHSFDSDTLKYWVEAATPTVDITHIWVKDGYSQFKVAISDPFPVLEKSGVIMTRASQKYGYWGKAMIGANGSGFVTNSFYAEISRWYPQWRWSSVSPIVIIDGNVLRNYTNLALPGVGANTYGMKRDGYFEAYYVNSTDTNANIKGVESLINDGVLYTFAFNPVLVYKGVKATGLEAVPNIRQGVGQIDKNNFVIVTNTTVNRNWGLTTQQLADIMSGLGCYMAFNTDGGGSTNLIYKNRGTDDFSGIVTTDRDVADIFYFVEK